MIILAYDFETSGLPLFDQPSDHPDQPHIVQVGAALVDSDTRKIISSIDMIVKPEGWTIPAETSEIHGITTERALQVGLPEHYVVANNLWMLWKLADLRVGHNETFDARIMRIALKRYFGDKQAEEWKAGPAECTARMSSPIMKMEPTDRMRAAGRNHPKTPKLTEAYEFFTGRELQNAHSAMADALGCLEVYWAIKDGVTARFDEVVTTKATAAADGEIPYL